jgi:hypothetical protein
MSPIAKTLLAGVLTLPLVAFAAGLLVAPAEVDPDRSRPVIIGNLSDDGEDDGASRETGPQDADRVRDDRDGDRGDRRDDRREDPPYTVVTPPPRDLDDDDGGDDGDDGGEDRDEDDTDDEGSDDD